MPQPKLDLQQLLDSFGTAQRGLDRRVELAAAFRLGNALQRAERYEQARGAYDHVLRLTKKHAECISPNEFDMCVGLTLSHLGDLEGAIHHLRLALDAAERSSTSAIAPSIRVSLGRTYLQANDSHRARSEFYRTLISTAWTPEPNAIAGPIAGAYMLEALSDVHSPLVAERHLRAALGALRGKDDGVHAAVALYQLGLCRIEAGDLNEAILTLDAGASRAAADHAPITELQLVSSLALALAAAARFSEVAPVSVRLNCLASQIKTSRAQIVVHLTAGLAALSRTHTPDAVDSLRCGLELAVSTDDRLASMVLHGTLGSALSIRGDYEDALAHYETQEAIAKELDHPRWPLAVADLAAGHADLAGADQALAHLETIRSSLRGLRDGKMRLLLLETDGEINFQLGDYEASLAAYECLASEALELASDLRYVGALYGIANVQTAQGRFELAERYESELRSWQDRFLTLLEQAPDDLGFPPPSFQLSELVKRSALALHHLALVRAICR